MQLTFAKRGGPQRANQKHSKMRSPNQNLSLTQAGSFRGSPRTTPEHPPSPAAPSQELNRAGLPPPRPLCLGGCRLPSHRKMRRVLGAVLLQNPGVWGAKAPQDSSLDPVQTREVPRPGPGTREFCASKLYGLKVFDHLGGFGARRRPRAQTSPTQFV